MDIKLILEFLVILGALAMGARAGGVGLGLWGAVGLLVLVVGFGIVPAALPGDVLLIVLTVIMAASAMEVAGGIDFLVRVAEKIVLLDHLSGGRAVLGNQQVFRCVECGVFPVVERREKNITVDAAFFGQRQGV